MCLVWLGSSRASWGSRTALPQHFLIPRWARTPRKGSRSPSPSLPPPLRLAEQQEQQAPQRVAVLGPKLCTAINTTPRLSKSPAGWEKDPARWRLRRSPQLLFHQGSDCGRPCPMPCWGRAVSSFPPGEEAALLLNPPEALMERAGNDSWESFSSWQHYDFAGCC